MSDFSDFEDEEGVDEPDLDEEGEGEEEEEEVVEENPLTKEVIGDCLSLLCKIGNGLAHAYVRLDIHEREITDISLINCFIHLRYVDISNNKIRDISALNSLTHLLTLKADNNMLRSAKLDELPYLQTANFAKNKIMDTEGLNHPLLESLNLSSNEIIEVTGMDSKKLERLQTLEIRDNKLQSTKGLALTNLTRLYLGYNEIRKIEDLANLQHLTTLFLRKNKIENLDGFSEAMKNLQYINLRENQISDMAEISKLKCLPRLRALILYENPVSSENSYRIETFITLRRLERLDKDPYTEDERQEAEEIYEQRRQEEAMKGTGELEVINSDDDD